MVEGAVESWLESSGFRGVRKNVRLCGWCVRFLVPDKKLVVEIEPRGSTAGLSAHLKDADLRRNGYKVCRIWEDEARVYGILWATRVLRRAVEPNKARPKMAHKGHRTHPLAHPLHFPATGGRNVTKRSKAG